MNQFLRNIRRRLLASGFYPRSGLARFTGWVAALYLASELLALIIPTSSKWSGIFGGWAGFFEFVAICSGILLLIRWVRQKVLWRLRNRLIVTYMFIGVIPVVLILAMFGIAGYIVGNQLTTMLVHRDLLAQAQSLNTLNSTVSLEIANQFQKKSAGALHLTSLNAGGAPDAFPQWSMAAWINGKSIPIAGASSPPADLADRNRDLSGLVSYDRAFWIRSFRTTRTESGSLQVVIAVPISQELLSRAVPDLGAVTLYRLEPVAAQSSGITFSDKAADKNKNFSFVPVVTAGSEPLQEYRFDPLLRFHSVFPATDWVVNGIQTRAWVQVNTRPSILNRRVFTDLGEVGSAFLIALIVVAIAFAIIELAALVIGVRLTRTITGSIAQLYRATQHINRGDLAHRIRIQSSDQLASLEKSFNSMSESLERLIEEQKEKQRMQNELAIAQEVQAQLFPRGPKKVESLELHGVCKPARTVSGDYYDFISLGEERVGIAVGDISGKGISAALLMATIHSAVRVFELGAMPERGELVAAGAAAVAAAASVQAPRWSVATEHMESPAEVLALLNRHLYHSTPPEKYATLFLGIYDGESRKFMYSNGGHLPPFVIHESGEVRKLETGGLVIGLFPEIVLEEEEIRLAPGDVFVAFSDGVTEPENEFGEFGEERLLDLLRSNRHLSLERISDIVMAAVQDWIGENEQPDDVTLVLARVR
jgi:sigma-B regulation protein RsbU (phosphoserine phosphatase)